MNLSISSQKALLSRLHSGKKKKRVMGTSLFEALLLTVSEGIKEYWLMCHAPEKVLALEMEGIISAHNSFAILFYTKGIRKCCHLNRLKLKDAPKGIWSKSLMTMTPFYSHFKSQWSSCFLEDVCWYYATNHLQSSWQTAIWSNNMLVRKLIPISWILTFQCTLQHVMTPFTA